MTTNEYKNSRTTPNTTQSCASSSSYEVCIANIEGENVAKKNFYTSIMAFNVSVVSSQNASKIQAKVIYQKATIRRGENVLFGLRIVFVVVGQTTFRIIEHNDMVNIAKNHALRTYARLLRLFFLSLLFHLFLRMLLLKAKCCAQ